MFESVLKAVSALAAVAGLVFGVVQYTLNQSVEASQPYLTRKLQWCEQATGITARIAVSPAPTEEDLTAFWEMYWGVLGLVEGQHVEGAMKAFGDALRSGVPHSPIAGDGPAKGGAAPAETGRRLGVYSLELAHACRKELAADWSSSWSRVLR